MPTTTNYGWTTPADTDLVKDGASAIRTLGSSVDTTVKNLNPETTLGDISYRSSTSNVNTRLALGTAGQVLAVNSGATAPEWKTISSGKLLQVVYADTSTSTSITSISTFTDTTMTATITPSSTASKILVMAVQSVALTKSGVGNVGATMQLVRDSTAVFTMGGNPLFNSDTEDLTALWPLNYLDSPNTTSATTYKIQAKAYLSTTTVTYQPTTSAAGNKSTMLLLEIGA